MVVWTGILDHVVLTSVRKDILEQTVHESVPQIVNLTYVDTQTDRVLPVLQDGRVIIAPLNACRPTERIVSIRAMNSASTRRVTERTAVVCMAVNMGSNVTK